MSMLIKPITKLQRTVLLLVVFSAFLSLLRVQITQNLSYTFLLWNMFLAVIPFMIAEYVKIQEPEKLTKTKLILFIIAWLLFLPNAPYIITDFIHLKTNTKMAWYDLFMLFTNAATGTLLGLLSIVTFHDLVCQKWDKHIGKLFSIAVFFLCGFGIYLGRFLRFNTWDILFSPIDLIRESILSFKESTAWLITFGFGFLLWILFSVVKRSKIYV
ncbi:DUF1361 domain-containing protein [Tenacibaculum sp. 190524A05c]|uniref:DUF1361 domain-containing protein n=1 Tax=Tenacibaculum platacis TaxID=3137852 RepID=UPI0032B176DC